MLKEVVRILKHLWLSTTYYFSMLCVLSIWLSIWEILFCERGDQFYWGEGEPKVVF